MARLLSFAVIAAVCWRGNQDEFNIWLVIVLGQGHFLATNLYKAQRGQITPRGLAAYLLAAVTLLWMFPLPRPYHPAADDVALRAFTFIYLGFHIMVDEQFLAGQPPCLIRGLEIALVLVLFASVGLRGLYGYAFLPYGLVIAFLCLVVYAILSHRNPQVRSWNIFIFWGLWLTGGYKFLSVAVLYHYAHWYIHMYERFRLDRAQRYRYVATMLAVNGLVYALYVPFLLRLLTNPHHSFNTEVFDPLLYLYLPHYFWIWTILHVMFSSRPRDLQYVCRVA